MDRAYIDAVRQYQSADKKITVLKKFLTLFRSRGENAENSLLFALDILEREMRWTDALALLDEATLAIPTQKLRWISRKPELFAKSGAIKKALEEADTVISTYPQSDTPKLLEILYINRARWTATLHGSCLESKKAFEAWGEKYANHLMEHPNWSSDCNFRDPHRKLRVGYLSGDLKNHAVRYFIEGYLANRDRLEFEVHAFMTMPTDLVSENLKRLFDQWHDVQNESDDDLLQMIRAINIDILVDLSGHTLGNRLKVFARRAAPVQVTWFGFLPTLGMKAIDWRLSDSGITPQETGQFYTEKLFRMKCSITYTPPINCDVIYPSPWKKNGFITLGCLNHSRKISPEALRVWCEILQANTNAVLFLIGDRGSSTPEKSDLANQLMDLGFPRERVAISPRLNMRDFMNLGSIVDFAVDPFPWSGGTTTLHTLWMGLPIIALGKNGAGAEHSAAASTLRGCALECWVAGDSDEYRSKIADLIHNPHYLDEARALARRSIENSPLMDYRSRALELQQAFRTMWHTFLRESNTA